MKILRLLIVLLLLGAVMRTSALTTSSDGLQLLADSDGTDDSGTTGESDHSDATDESDHTDETDDEDETDHSDETDDEDSEEEESEKEDAYERELEIETSDKQFQVKSKLKFGDQEDEIEVEFEVEDKAEIQLQYKTESSSQEAKFKYRVSFEKIIEYVDSTQTGFNGTQDIVSELEFKQWDPIQYTVSNVNGVDVYVITATTSDQVFSLVIRISTSIIDLGNSTLTPNSVKIDVIINDYNYVNSNSSLAVKAKIKTESKLEMDDETVEEAAGFVEGESQVGIGLLSAGFFSWADTAEADGVTVDVISSTLEDSSSEDTDLEENETSNKLYFSFMATNASSIVWDPKVGVISEGTQQLIQSIEEKYGGLASNGGAALPGFGIWMLIFSVATLTALYHRKRNQI